MDPTKRKYWCPCSLLSLSAALVTFSMSQFVEIQIGNSKLAVSIIVVIMAVGFSCFVHKIDFIRNIMDLIRKNRFCWTFKAIVVFIVLVFVTMLSVLMKYPRFRLPGEQQNRSISEIRSYCQNPNFFDPKIKAICLNLPKERKNKQGDKMEFVSAVSFSFITFSTSILLALREEHGLFYMCLELTMNAAVEIPGIGDSILNWYYVGPTAFYCFLLIIVRCYFHSSDEVRRMSGNGDEDDNDGDDGEQRPTEVGDELRQPDLELNQQGDGDDGAEDGGGGRVMDDQGRRTDLDSAGSGWEIVSAEEVHELTSERDVGILSGEIKRILNASNIHGGREITRKAVAVLVPNIPPDMFSVINIFPVLYCLTAGIVFASRFPGYDTFFTYINTAVIIIITITIWRKEIWITCKRISDQCYGWYPIVCLFSLELLTGLLRQLGLKQNEEVDSGDSAEGGGGAKTGDQGDSAGTDREIVFGEEGDEHEAERAEGTSRFDEIERIITSIGNVPGERVTTRRKHAVPSDQEKFPGTTDGKSVATEASILGKSIIKSLSPDKED